MIVIPIFHKPKIYQKVTRKTVEVVGATCRVRTYVSFSPITVLDEKTLLPKYFEPCKYGFEMLVELNKHEYEANKHNLEEYVCQKAKGLCEYDGRLRAVLDTQFPGREYTVETFLSPDILDAVKIHTITHEYEDLVPM